MFKRLALTIIVILYSINVLAQLKDYTFTRYTEKDGLPDAGLRDLYFDKQGRLWISSTSSGMVYYDGKTFKAINESVGLSNNFAFRSVQDKDGSIWVASRNGLNHVKQYQIDTFLTTPKIDKSSFFTNVMVDKKGDFYAMGFPGLFKFNGKDFSKILLDSAKSVLFSYCTPDNTIYYITDKGIVVWKDKQVIKIIDESKGLKAKNAFRLLPYRDSKLLIGAFDGLFIYDLRTEQSIKINVEGGKDVSIFGMEHLEGENYLMSDGGTGIYIFDGITLKPIDWPYKESVLDIKKDPFGNIWLAGTYLYKLSKKHFSVKSEFSSDEQNYKWFYFEGNTLVGMLENDVFLKRNNSKKVYSFEAIVQRVIISKDTLFVGCSNGSVWKVYGSKKIEIIPSNSVNKQADIVQSMFLDDKNNLWIGRNYTVVKLDPSGKYKIVPFKDREGLGTYHFLKHKTGFYISNETGMFKLEGDSVFSPYKKLINAKHAFKYAAFDRYDRLWFAEDGKGLGYISPQGNIKYVNSSNRIPISEIRSIYFEKGKDIGWVQFLGGILRIEYSQNGIKGIHNYPYETAGFTSLNSNATYFQDTLYSVDNNRLVYKNSNSLPKSPILNIRVFNINESSSLILPIYNNSKDSKISLTKGGGVFGVYVNAIDYSSVNAHLYHFQIIGNGLDISVIQESGEFNIGKLTPGEYTLKIKVAENEFMLSKAVAYTHTLKVPAFWYQTILFKVAIFLLLIFLLVYIVKYLYRKKELKKQLDLENENIKIELENKVLKAQLDPHLVFNLLNNVQSKILLESKELAIETISELSKFLRDSLELSNKSFIPLKDEIEYVKNYLQFKLKDLKKVKINFEDNVSNIHGDLLIPSLLWQPLVENAVKYYNEKDGFIFVSFYLIDGFIVGEIKNSVDGITFNGIKVGNGLRLVNERVMSLNKNLGNDAGHFIYEVNNKYFIASISLNIKILEND